MQLTQSPKFNRNYAAKIVEIKDFIKHPNPKCERLKCCTIDGYSIAVSIDTNPGTYVYFPIECAIDDRFLSANNLFRDKVKNVDKGQAGFFEDNCRVKIIKLQGYPSEGFITPLPPIVTFDDDPLRILRGIRFSITKRLRVSEDMWQAMKAYDYFDKMPVVSEERIREELTKCFKCNSSLTLGWLSELTDLRDYIFKNTNLWLKPTSEK